MKRPFATMADDNKENLFDEAEDDEEKVEEEDDEVVDHKNSFLIDGLTCSDRKGASLSFPAPLFQRRSTFPRRSTSSQYLSIIPDWKEKITSDLSEAPELRLFGHCGFSAEYFLGPEDIEELEGNESSGDSEFEEVDSTSYSSTLPSDEKPFGLHADFHSPSCTARAFSKLESN